MKSLKALIVGLILFATFLFALTWAKNTIDIRQEPSKEIYAMRQQSAELAAMRGKLKYLCDHEDAPDWCGGE